MEKNQKKHRKVFVLNEKSPIFAMLNRKGLYKSLHLAKDKTQRGLTFRCFFIEEII